MHAAFVRLYQVELLTTQAVQNYRNIFFCRVSNPYGISYHLDWDLARIFPGVSDCTSNVLWSLYYEISTHVTDLIATIIESLSTHQVSPFPCCKPQDHFLCPHIFILINKQAPQHQTNPTLPALTSYLTERF